MLGLDMLDEKAREQFRLWGAKGGKAKARKYTKEQIADMARRGKKRARIRRANGK